jgi:hypothetical protein
MQASYEGGQYTEGAVAPWMDQEAMINPLNLELNPICYLLALLAHHFLHSPFASSILRPNILLSTLFSKTLSLRSFLNVKDQVSHPI